MTEVRFHSSDPRRRPRAWKIDGNAGRVVGALLVVAGTLVAIGLFGAPDLVAYVVRSAERLTIRATARRGLLAFDSVRLRYEKLDKRVRTDELFLARMAVVLELPRPVGLVVTDETEPAATPDALEAEVHRLARRLRSMEGFRRTLASAKTEEPGRIPSRSPVEPSSAVPAHLFGPRVSPFTLRPEFHAGLGLAAPEGSPVLAPAGGRVVFAGRVPGSAGAEWRSFRNVVVIAHGERTRTVLGYLGEIRVRRGQVVRRGEQVGEVGVSLFSPTPQLHYGVWRWSGARWTPVDPRLHVLDAEWIGASDLAAPVVPPRDVELPSVFR